LIGASSSLNRWRRSRQSVERGEVLTTRLRCDEWGIALQTVIVMVALIAVAVTVSTVILTRGGEVADDLERQNVTFDPVRFRTQALCEEYGYEWDAETKPDNPVCKDPS